MPGRTVAAGIMLVLFALVASPSLAREIGPEADLCGEINRLTPGEELVLGPGDYQGPCTIRRGGTPGAPIVITAKDLGNRPRIVYHGVDANVIEIRAGHVTLRGLRIGPSRGDVDGVRIYVGNGITIEQCEFSGLDGIAVVANHASVRGLTVRGNVVRDTKATAMYFGCHNGLTCTVSNLLIERNYIHGVQAPKDSVGYGMEVKLNSTAVIRDNVVVNTKGPGIMVYGAQDTSAASLVERNFVMGSRESSGIVVGGGPAYVRNNVSVLNGEAGIGVEDYHRRGLIREIYIIYNTLYGNSEGGVILPDRGVQGRAVIFNNAVHSPVGVARLPKPSAGVQMLGNVDCSSAPCFRNPEARDFSPFPGSPLVGPGVLQAEPWFPRDDFFGTRRGLLPTVGAIERPSGPIPLAIKP